MLFSPHFRVREARRRLVTARCLFTDGRDWYLVKSGINGTKAMELGAGIKYVEAPIDAGLSLVPLLFQGMNVPAEGFLVREMLPERIAGEDA